MLSLFTRPLGRRVSPGLKTEGAGITLVVMGGRFGKYGDAKRKARIRQNRLRPFAPPQNAKGKPLKGPPKKKAPPRIKSESS